MLQASSTRETRDGARELKFLVTPDLAAAVLDWARPRLPADPHAGGPSGDEYRTTSLYYDTTAFAVYHRRGSYARSKLRVRRYGSEDIGFLERKLRTGRLLSKRRTTIPLADLWRLEAPTRTAPWAGGWFGRRLDARALVPTCRVSYRRRARVGIGPQGPFRLTVDDQLVAAPLAALTFTGEAGRPALEHRTIVEMKYQGEPPAVLRHLVETFALVPGRVSKYRFALESLARAGALTGPDQVDLGAWLGSAESEGVRA